MKTGILITGAWSGLGQSLAEAANQLDDIDCVVATDINREIESRYHGSSGNFGFVMDVRSQNSINAVREKLHALGIRIKYIINNAGVAMFYPVSEANEDQLDTIVKVNTYGPVLTVSAFLNDLIENRGRVVQISSDSVRLSGLFQPYASTKVALETLSVAMRQELGLHGIKLILIRPGAMRTKLLKEVNGLDNLNENSLYKKEFRKFTEIAQKEVGRIVEPSKVANLVMKALRTKRPKLAYSINKNAKISFLVKFPQRWIDYLMQKTVLSKS